MVANLIICQRYRDRDPLKPSQTGHYQIIIAIAMASYHVAPAYMKIPIFHQTTQNHCHAVNQSYGCDLT